MKTPKPEPETLSQGEGDSPTPRRRLNGQAGKPKLADVDKRAQASLMMMERLFGRASLRSLGEKYNLDSRTVQRRLALARQDGVPDEAREIFIREMLPESMAVLQEALRGSDLRLATMVAMKIVDGLKAMDAPAAAALGGMVEETLESWKLKRVTRRVDDAAGVGAVAEVIDAVAEYPQPAGPPSQPALAGAISFKGIRVPFDADLVAVAPTAVDAPTAGEGPGPGSVEGRRGSD